MESYEIDDCMKALLQVANSFEVTHEIISSKSVYTATIESDNISKPIITEADSWLQAFENAFRELHEKLTPQIQAFQNLAYHETSAMREEKRNAAKLANECFATSIGIPLATKGGDAVE